MTRVLGISGALKAPSAGSLVRSALRLPAGTDWTNESGLEYLPEACGRVQRFLYCDPSDPSKEDAIVPSAQQFRPFVLYYPEGCSPLSITPEEWGQRAVNGLTATESSGLALELNSSYSGVNPDLLNTAIDVSPTSGLCNDIPQTILGLIKAMVGCGYTGDIMFHAPAWSMPIFYRDTLIRLENGVFKLGNHTVIFDAGYTNQVPTITDPGNPVAPDDRAWIYATSPVDFDLGVVQEFGIDESKKGALARQNAVYVIAERPAIVRFDTCCVYAAAARVC